MISHLIKGSCLELDDYKQTMEIVQIKERNTINGFQIAISNINLFFRHMSKSKVKDR